MFIRYELYVDDEYQDVGIFQGLSELDLDDDTSDSYMAPFDNVMIIPFETFINQKTKSWFTEKGEKKFLNDINRIIALYDDNGLFEVRRIVEENLQDIVYSDEYQVITKL